MTALLGACLIQHFLKEKVAKDKQQLCRMVHLGHRQNKGEISPTKEGREKPAFHLGPQRQN